MTCPGCKSAADSAAPHVCRDPATCPCAHRPGTPREDTVTETPKPVAEMVAEFHAAMGDAPGTVPIHDIRGRELRESLLEEEFAEYRTGEARDNLVEIADGLADMVYVAYGTAHRYGIPLDRVIAAVHASNMTKTFVTGGKAIKGEGYEPPNVAAILDDAELDALKAAMMGDSRERIEEIQTEMDALPKDERTRLEAANAPLLRIQLAHFVGENKRLKDELERTSMAAAQEIWVKAGFEAIVHWKQRAEQAEAAIDRVRDLIAGWHGAPYNLAANDILAALDTPTPRRRTPMTDDLRDKIAELLTRQLTNGLCPLDGPCEMCDCFDPEHRQWRDLADAVMALVGPELERLRAERGAFKAAVDAATEADHAHIKEFHPTRIRVDDCAGCRVGLVLSKLRPAKPDSQDEIYRRLAALESIERVPVDVVIQADPPYDSGLLGQGVITFDTTLSDDEMHRAIATGIARVLREIAVEVERERDEEFPPAALDTPTPTEGETPCRRTEQDGGIPNDAITRDDWKAAHAWYPTDTTEETETPDA